MSSPRVVVALRDLVLCLAGIADDVHGEALGGECDNCGLSRCSDDCAVAAMRRIVEAGRAALAEVQGGAL